MEIKFNIKDNANTEAKVLEFALSKGYTLLVFDPDTQSYIPNPETPKDYSERILKREFLEPWVIKKARIKYDDEYNSLIGD